MLSVQGQYYFIFSIGKYTDFIKNDDLISFDLIEEAGNILPTFSIDFVVDSEKIISLIQENNPIKVTFGRDQKDLIDISLLTCGLTYEVSTTTQIKANIEGTLNVPKYNNQTQTQITQAKSAIAIMLDIAKNNSFRTGQSNITTSSDSMNHIQYNNTDRDFINELWMHSNIPNSFPVIGITSRNEFIVNDARKSMKRVKDGGIAPSWVFTFRDEESKAPNNVIKYSAPPLISVNNGFINNWVGYNQTKYILDTVTSQYTALTPSPKTLMALNNTFNTNSGVTHSAGNSQLINDNTDISYWESYVNNLTNLALFSTVLVDIIFTGPYYPIRVLDKVLFQSKQIGETQNSAEYETGVYLVARVSRNISGSVMTTQVRLCRENLNKQRSV